MTKVYKSAHSLVASLKSLPSAIFHGDCLNLLKKLPDESVDLTVTSPPYFIGKEYERFGPIEDFELLHARVLPEVWRVTKQGGSICWQTGYHVKESAVLPLDYYVFQELRQLPGIRLRNRIIWTFGHGFHASNRFSGRHETMLWFTKGENFTFDLDAVRVQQKYPGKRHYKGPNKGEYSGNPLGKNPSDVWDFPNVNANHVEKTIHPCQFPVALAERMIKSVTKPGDLVFDPFTGASSTGVAAIRNGRRFVGCELVDEYVRTSVTRLTAAVDGTVQVRPLEAELFEPDPRSAVARAPEHFTLHQQHEESVLE